MSKPAKSARGGSRPSPVTADLSTFFLEFRLLFYRVGQMRRKQGPAGRTPAHGRDNSNL